ncbi:MAG: porin [Aestuariivita sp.]|nr:porin [Aestuariivita sp.]MCY4202996.1 porin [Aestuariivita sp.]
MKRILFAAAALLATASMSAADVTIGGYGRFGIDYNEGNDPDVNGRDEINLTSRLRLQFDMTAESDAGVTFGARFRAQAEQRDGNPNGASFNGGRFYARMGPATLGVGNTFGAIDSIPGLNMPTKSVDTGVDGMGFHNGVVKSGIDAYSATGAGRSNGVELIYSMAGVGFHVSGSSNKENTEDRIAAHVSYSINGWTVALGAQDSDAENEKLVLATVTGDLGFAGLGLSYANNQNYAPNGEDVDKFRIYGSVPLAAGTTLVAWGANEDNPGEPSDGASFGLDIAHDLGGGVTFVAGVVDPSVEDTTQVQAGVYFNF